MAPGLQGRGSKARKHNRIFIYKIFPFIHISANAKSLLANIGFAREFPSRIRDGSQRRNTGAEGCRSASSHRFSQQHHRNRGPEGFVLAVQATGTIQRSPGQRALAVAVAISKAGTAAFLSSQGNAFSSRSAGFIVQQHFPPQVNFTPPGPLVGVNFSNQSFSDVNRFKDPSTYQAGKMAGQMVLLLHSARSQGTGWNAALQRRQLNWRDRRYHRRILKF